MDERQRNGLLTYYGDQASLLNRDECKAVKQEHLDEIESRGGKPQVVGGYSIRFDNSGKPNKTDLTGQWFDKDTYLGPHDGGNVDVYFHHSYPIYDDRVARVTMKQLAEQTFGVAKATREELGIWVECVLDMSDDYQRLVADLASEKILGWSSGSAGHLVRIEPPDDETMYEKYWWPGYIRRWPVIEHSLTPSPAEPRNMVQTIRTVKSEPFLKPEKKEPAVAPESKDADDAVGNDSLVAKQQNVQLPEALPKVIVFDFGALKDLAKDIASINADFAA